LMHPSIHRSGLGSTGIEYGKALISKDDDDGGSELTAAWLGGLEDTDLEDKIRGLPMIA
jgi:hypothetical protein